MRRGERGKMRRGERENEEKGREGKRERRGGREIEEKGREGNREEGERRGRMWILVCYIINEHLLPARSGTSSAVRV